MARNPMARASFDSAVAGRRPASPRRATTAFSRNAGAGADHLYLDLAEAGRQPPAVHHRDHVVVDLQQRLAQTPGQHGSPAVGDQSGHRAERRRRAGRPAPGRRSPPGRAPTGPAS